MRLSSHDASFIYTETASGPMHSVGMTLLDGPATVQEIRDYYAARIHLVPRLRQKLVFVPFNMAHPKWVDDPDFDLNNHIKPHAVPPGTTVQRAQEIALELGEPLLDREKPLWLTYILEGVEGKTMMVQLAHHAFVDGATAVAMTMVLTDTAPDAPPPPPPNEAWNPQPVPTAAELMAEAATENATAASNLLQTLQANMPDAEFSAQAGELVARLTQPVMQAPFNAGLVGPKRGFHVLQYPLSDFKTLRGKFGGTLNDIVVAVVVEAVSRWMEAQGENLDRQKLRLMCPVNVRDGDVDPLSIDGNRVSAMFPVFDAFPRGIEARLIEVRAELDRIKARKEPEVLDALQTSQPSVPPLAMAATQAVGTAFDPTQTAAQWPMPIAPHAGPRPAHVGFNFTCTNVPGPNWTQYIAGHKVETMFGTLMLSGTLGFGASAGSYNGQLFFGFTSEPRLVPNAELLVGFAADNMETLKQLAAG